MEDSAEVRNQMRDAGSYKTLKDVHFSSAACEGVALVTTTRDLSVILASHTLRQSQPGVEASWRLMEL